MPPKPNTKETRIVLTELTFLCEWDECSQLFQNIDDFLFHMSEHMIEYHQPGLEEGDFECKWRECNTIVKGERTDFFRHAYFHCFHVKIKNIGEQMIKKMELRGCMLDNQSRNLIPELPERLQCGWNMCENVIDNPEIFYRHVDNHAENFPEGNNLKGGARCEWEGCESVAKNKYKLKEHLRSHTQEKVIACPTCGGLFSSRTKFVDHVKRQAGVESQCYQCSHCNKRFSSERLLRDHVRHHVNQYKCPCCEMTCPTPSSLKSHLRYRHTNEKPFKCDSCDYGAKTLSDLKKHTEFHTADAPFCCHFSNCDYVARSFSSLTNHYKRKHQDVTTQNYACHVCPSVFTRGSKLTVHLKKKHKFKWPSGHSRFRYKMHEDGFWRLQTVRYESMQLSQNQESSSHDGMDSDKSKDFNENQDKFAIGHDQSSDMICSEDIEIPIEGMPRSSEAITIATGDEETGYVINAADLQGQQVCQIDLLSVVTQPAAHSHMTKLTDIDDFGNPREINVRIIETPEGGYQVLDLSTSKRVQEDKHMTYNLEMLSDVAVKGPGNSVSEEI